MSSSIMSTLLLKRIPMNFLASRFISNKKHVANQTDIKKEVKNLYKTLIYLSKDWHTDLRPQIKRGFMKNKDVTDIEEIKKLIARGEYICREITATYHLKKYRTMKRRYYSEEQEKQNFDEVLKNISNNHTNAPKSA